MDWIEEERKISPEELRREMYRILVSNNIITEKDLKARVEEELQPELDNFVKATSYILESHESLFKLFNQNGAYYEAVKLARRLVEAKVIDKKEEPYHYTPYYFDKDDKDTMNSIDAKLKEWYPKNVIPTEHPFIRKIRLNPKPCLDAKVEEDCLPTLKTINKKESTEKPDCPLNEHLKEPKEQKKIKDNPGLISVSKYIRGKHKYLFNNLDIKDELDKAYRVSKLLAEKGVVSKRNEEFYNTHLYFLKNDNVTMKAIDDEINRLFGKDGKRRPKEKPLKPEPEFMTVSKYLIYHHPGLFENLTTGSTFVKANYIAKLLAEKGVISKRDESYHCTNLYFRRNDRNIMDRIDGAISGGVLEKAREISRVNVY